MRGLKSYASSLNALQFVSRTPHRVRGLKFGEVGRPPALDPRRTPHGVRGLKSVAPAAKAAAHRRTPHGVRGLKWMLTPMLGVTV